MPRDKEKAAALARGSGDGDGRASPRRGDSSTKRQRRQGARGKCWQRGGLLFIGKRRVASLDGGWLHRTIGHAGELLHRDAIAFRVELLQIARPQAPKGIQVRLPDGTILVSNWARWQALAWPYKDPIYGRQEALSLDHWYRPEAAMPAKQEPLWEAANV
jgi:hypothetical protein